MRLLWFYGMNEVIVVGCYVCLCFELLYCYNLSL